VAQLFRDQEADKERAEHRVQPGQFGQRADAEDRKHHHRHQHALGRLLRDQTVQDRIDDVKNDQNRKQAAADRKQERVKRHDIEE
jgi:hypothetical protein